MASSDRLEQLKKQVRDTSNQQNQMKVQKERTKAAVSYHEQEIVQNQQDMTQLVRSVFGQSELAAAKERELIKDQMERFSYRQKVMNEQLIALNDSLSSTAALEALYAEKRRELDNDYEEQKRIIQARLERMKNEAEQKHRKQEEEILKKIEQAEERLSRSKRLIAELDGEIKLKKAEIEELTAKAKEKTFKASFKENLIDRWFVWAVVGFIGTIAGGIFGWGIFKLIEWIANGVIGFFSSVLDLFGL